jgi:cobalt-zinc-cadmium efflux system outer membrane protein
MRRLLWWAALAGLPAGAAAQQSGLPARAAAPVAPFVAECAARRPAADTLCVSRRAAIDSAIRRNPQLRAGAEQIAQARARKTEGAALPDPVLSYQANSSTGLLGGDATDRILSATLSIPFPDKFRLLGRIGRADVGSTEATVEALRLGIAAQASEVYDSALAVLRQRRTLEEVRGLATEFLRRTRARFEAGTAPRLDVMRAQVDLAQAENDLIASERGVANAFAALNRLLDRPLGAPILLADSLELPPELPPLDSLEAQAMALRPELASLQRQQEGAHAASQLAREFWLPDLSMGLTHNYASPGPGNFFTGLQMPIPFLFWNHTRGQLAETVHRERELEASARDLRAEIGQDVRAAHAAAATALRQARHLHDVLLPAVREAYRVASLSYGLGGLSALEVLDARRALSDAESQYTGALAAANIARADLGRAVGRSLDGSGTGGSPHE